MKNLADLHQALYDEAYELACQKANEIGNIDIDYDYEIMATWTENYYINLCKDEGLDPDINYLS